MALHYVSGTLAWVIIPFLRQKFQRLVSCKRKTYFKISPHTVCNISLNALICLQESCTSWYARLDSASDSGDAIGIRKSTLYFEYMMHISGFITRCMCSS